MYTVLCVYVVLNLITTFVINWFFAGIDNTQLIYNRNKHIHCTLVHIRQNQSKHHVCIIYYIVYSVY